MQLVVDANILFAVIIGRDKTLRLFFSDKIELLAPEFLFEEMENNKSKISKLSGLFISEIETLLSKIKSKVHIVYPDEVKSFISEAERICPDSKDLAYFTVALAFKAAIWSREKSFKKQNKVKIFDTPELLKMFNVT